MRCAKIPFVEEERLEPLRDSGLWGYNSPLMSSVAQLQLDPDGESLAAPDAWRSMAAFLVSGMLMSFLGAILPAWGYHLRLELHRSRRLFPEPGFRAAFVGGRCSLSASPPRAEVRVDSCEPARPVAGFCSWRFRHRRRRRPGGCSAFLGSDSAPDCSTRECFTPSHRSTNSIAPPR